MSDPLEIPVDAIHVKARPKTQEVSITFGDVTLVLSPDITRELAFTLMTAAAKAEGGL